MSLRHFALSTVTLAAFTALAPRAAADVDYSSFVCLDPVEGYSCMAPLVGYVLGTELSTSGSPSPAQTWARLALCAANACGCSGDCVAPCGAIPDPSETDFDVLSKWGGAIPDACGACLDFRCGSILAACEASGCP